MSQSFGTVPAILTNYESTMGSLFDEITERRKELFMRGNIALCGNRMVARNTQGREEAEEYNRLAAAHGTMKR